MNDQWSTTTKEYTRVAFEDLSFATRNDRVWLKHIAGDFGFINDDDALSGCYAIFSRTGETLDKFDSISSLLKNGWVLD